MKNLCINNQINILVIMCDVIKIITSSLYFVVVVVFVVVDNQVHYIRNIMFYITTYGKNTNLLQIFETHFIFFNHYMMIEFDLRINQCELPRNIL